MKLTEALEVSCIAEADLPNGTIKVESTPHSDGTYAYGYTMQVAGVHHHSDAYSICEYEDLESELLDLCIDVNALDWRASIDGIDLSRCTCKSCQEFCLRYKIMPDGLPFHKVAGYWLLWRMQDIQWWFWCRWHRLYWHLWERRKWDRAVGLCDEAPGIDETNEE